MLVDDLIARFSDVDPGDVEAVARDEYRQVAEHSKAPTFVGILSERRARQRIQQAPLGRARRSVHRQLTATH